MRGGLEMEEGRSLLRMRRRVRWRLRKGTLEVRREVEMEVQ